MKWTLRMLSLSSKRMLTLPGRIAKSFLIIIPSPMSSFKDQQTILFLAANPKGTNPLRIDQELHDIAGGLEATS